MFPGYASVDTRNMTLRNAIDFGEFVLILTGGATLAYFNDLGSGKDRAFIRFAFLVWFVWTFGLSTFADHIVNIIEVGAKKKMSRIAAELIVAFMQNMQVVWYWAIRQGPGNPMRTLTNAIYRHCAVSVAAYTGSPVPAIIWSALVDSCEKAFCNRQRAAIVTTNIVRLLTWLFCLFQSLTTSASTKFGRNPFTGAAIVPVYIFEWLTFDVSSTAVCFGGNCGFLPTSAVAITVRDFIRGWIRGMLTHVGSSFQLLTMPRAVVSAPWFFYWFFSCNYTTNPQGMETL